MESRGDEEEMMDGAVCLHAVAPFVLVRREYLHQHYIGLASCRPKWLSAASRVLVMSCS